MTQTMMKKGMKCMVVELMKFKDYLTENEDYVEKTTNLILKNCQPYLRQLSKDNFDNEEVLFSGKKGKKDFEKLKVRQDRKPKDTPFKLHKYMDDWFYDKFSIRARSQIIFCTSDIMESKSYGQSSSDSDLMTISSVNTSNSVT